MTIQQLIDKLAKIRDCAPLSGDLPVLIDFGADEPDFVIHDVLINRAKDFGAFVTIEIGDPES